MEKLQNYRCELCGNIISVLNVGGGQLVCCGQNMTPLSENTTDAAKEKHVPVIEKTSTGYTVTVGSVAHPMLAEHYIQWIELIADGNSHICFLKPGDKPQASFCVQANNVSAREYCNLHGLWKA